MPEKTVDEAVEQAIRDWIREDAPVAVKMMMIPEHVRSLRKHVSAALLSEREKTKGAVEALETARDLLMERIHGNPARSAAHNARLYVESALSTLTQEKTNG
jgi:hypothetical protein